MSELTIVFISAWYILCGFCFARSVKEGATLFNDGAPFGLSVIFWVILMPISGLFKYEE